jgi:sec-independent protein translocase protein TatA
VFDFSPVQILIVLAIALLVFGPKRLPELARSVGRGVREFRSGISMEEPAATPPRSSRAVIRRPDTDDRPGSDASEAPAAASAPPAGPAEVVEDDSGERHTGVGVAEDLMVPGDDQPPGSRP